MQKQTLKKAYKKTKRKHITPWKILAIICAVVMIVSIPLSILLQKFVESLLIHCPACGLEVSRYAPTCPRCGHSIYLIRPLQQETVIKVIPTDQRKPESTRETTGCLSSFFGYVSLVVGAVLFNFIGYFIVLVILTLCGVFSFGEAVFLLLVGIVLAFLFWPLVASFALLNFLD